MLKLFYQDRCGRVMWWIRLNKSLYLGALFMRPAAIETR
jgi:hypothetical protein